MALPALDPVLFAQVLGAVVVRREMRRRKERQARSDWRRKKRESDPEFREREYARDRVSYYKRTGNPEARCHIAARFVRPTTEGDLLEILKRQRYRCAATGLPLDFALSGSHHPLMPTLDHILPRSRGGTNDPGNLRWVIWAVNFVRTDSAADELLAHLIRPSEELRARLEASAPIYVREAR